MDKSLLLRTINKALRVGGLLPYKSSKPTVWMRCHKVYCHVAAIYFYLFVFSQAIELVNIFRHDTFVVMELLNILGVFLLYSIAIVKLTVVRSDTMGDLYDEINEQETAILNSTETESKSIYNKYVRICHVINKYFLWIAFACVTPFFITPLIEGFLSPIDEIFVVVNGTKVYQPRPLPFVNWYPFDRYKYYKTTFVMHVLSGMIGATVTAVSDITFYGMILYAVGQLEILQHLFCNFRSIAKKLSNDADEEDSVVYVVKCLVVIHRKTIRFVERLNESMNFLMLLDIFSTTLQIAVLGFQVIVIGGDWRLYQVFIYIGTMFVQMLLFYMLANDVTLQSEQIAFAIWESDWTEISMRNKKSLAIVMMRAQKPLRLYIGPFYPMSTSTVLSIMRASYSYLALLKQVYG